MFRVLLGLSDEAFLASPWYTTPVQRFKLRTYLLPTNLDFEINFFPLFRLNRSLNIVESLKMLNE